MRFITTLALSGSILAAQGQTVSLHFPHFAGQEYHFWVFRGEGKDTIATDRLDEEGKGKLVLPERMKGHRGMTQWRLVEGGGLDIIFAGEDDFSVSCTEAQPSEDNIVYTGSHENTYLNPRYQRQQSILEKMSAMSMAAEIYKDDTAILPMLNAELQKQEQVYKLLQEETAASPLYAARFAQAVDLTRGLPPALPPGHEEAGKQMKDFVLNELDMDALYTSGHWQGVFEQFVGWYIYNEEHRPLFISDVIKLLNRTRADEIYAALAEKIIVACEKQNWHDQEIELAFFLLNDDRIKEPAGKVASLYTLLKIRKGQKAPLLTQGELPKKKTILAFYDSDCGNCAIQINELAALYPQLKKQGYEVVSLSADSDKTSFESFAQKLPWQAKYCDLEGFAGKDFRNYGIMGTPTFYLIDTKGVVQGRYARVQDLIWNEE